MSDSTAETCKLSMLWNWDTVDTCIISEQWHIHTLQQYAGSLLAIFFIVILVEGVRRVGRVYDRLILRRHQNRLSKSPSQIQLSETIRSNRPFRPSIVQQFIRAFFYLLQFGAGWMLMLAAMTHNGGVIISIFAGAFVGYLIFARDTVPGAAVIETTDYGICLEQVGFGKGKSKV